VILAPIASAGEMAYAFGHYLKFEMEQVPKWLSPKEKHLLLSAICAVATIH
jgi:hypothetical protein